MRTSWIVLLGLTACQARTELLIGVATDLEAPSALDRVQIEAKTESDTVLLEWDISGSSEPFNLPGSYGFVSDGDNVKVDIVLTGYLGSTPLVTRRAVMNLVEGETLFYRMGITGGCVGRNDCPPDWSCVEGVCRVAQIDSRQLPTYSDDLVTELTCAASVAYVDTATRTPMALSADAAECPSNLCAEGTCLSPPSVEIGARAIRGSQTVTYVDESGRTTTVPSNLADLDIAAIPLDGEGAIVGHGDETGTFSIEGVPSGEYFVKRGNSYFETSSDHLDLGYVDFGRSDRRQAADNTALSVSLTNMSPWESGDTLEAYAPNASAWWFYLESWTAIASGATSLVNYPLSRDSSSSGTLIEGDPFGLVHLTRKQTADGFTYRAATEAFQPPTFVQADGGTTPLTGSFAPLEQNRTLTLDTRVLDWDDAVGHSGINATLLHPRSESTSGIYITLAFQPGGPNYGFFSPTLDVLFADVPHGANRQLSNVTYGVPNIVSSNWVPIVHAQSSYSVEYQLPGSSSAWWFWVGIYTARVMKPGVATLPPTLGPVRSPRIAARDFFAYQAGVGANPVFTWDAPTLGAPTRYSVSIYELAVDAGRTVATLVGTFTTPRRTVTLPTGFLVEGHTYVALIGADTSGNIDAPSRLRYPHSYTTIASEMFTP